MDPSEGHFIDHDMLEHLFGPLDDELNAKEDATSTWEGLDPAHLSAGQPQSPSLYPDGADHSELYAAFMDIFENGTEEVRLASTRP